MIVLVELTTHQPFFTRYKHSLKQTKSTTQASTAEVVAAVAVVAPATSPPPMEVGYNFPLLTSRFQNEMLHTHHV